MSSSATSTATPRQSPKPDTPYPDAPQLLVPNGGGDHLRPPARPLHPLPADRGRVRRQADRAPAGPLALLLCRTDGGACLSPSPLHDSGARRPLGDWAVGGRGRQPRSAAGLDRPAGRHDGRGGGPRGGGPGPLPARRTRDRPELRQRGARRADRRDPHGTRDRGRSRDAPGAAGGGGGADEPARAHVGAHVACRNAASRAARRRPRRRPLAGRPVGVHQLRELATRGRGPAAAPGRRGIGGEEARRGSNARHSGSPSSAPTTTRW